MTMVLPKSPVPLWRPIKADPRAYFTDEEVARSKSYQRPLQYAKLVGTVLSLSEIVVLILTEAAPRFVRWTGIDNWVLQFIVVIAAFVVVDALLSLPVSIFRYKHDKKWNFETRAPGLLVQDTIKNTILNAFLFALIFLPIWLVIRWTTWWWLWGGVVLLVVVGILVLISPALQRIFNKFTPLDDQELRARLLALAQKAGARVSEIKVMDASKRTRKDNAFFTGLGKTKEIVVFDNLLEMGHDPVEVVVAHEIGHWRRKHTRHAIIESAVTGPIALGVAALFLRWDWLMETAGVTSERDPAAFPVFLLGAGVGFGLVTVVQLWLSRWNERSADLDALELTHNIDAFRNVWRQMHERNLPDLDPSWWARFRASHPPIAERLRFGEVWAQARAAAVESRIPETSAE
jgi:STE24 endopeptidase